ncbi:MAG: hypothetical protein SGPRY_013232 [Prymnesium sp.]
MPCTVEYELIIVSVCSLCSSLLLLLLHLKLPRIRRTPGWLHARAALCDALTSSLFVTLWCATRTGGLQEQSRVLFPLLLLLVHLEIAATTWRLLVYFDLLTIYRNPFFPHRHRWIYMLIVLAVSLSLTTFTSAMAHISRESIEQRALLLLCLGFIFMPIAMFVAVGGTLYALVRLLISNALLAARKEGAPPSISFLARQRVVRHGSAYLLLHSAQLLACLFLSLLALYRGEEGLHVAWYVLTLLIPGRPVITFVGWVVINDILFLLFGVCSFTKPWRAARSLESARREPAWRRVGSSTPSLLDTLSSTAASPADGSHGLRGWRQTAHEEAREWRRNEWKEDVGFQAELRFELLYDVAVGIGELAQEEREAERETHLACATRECDVNHSPSRI